MLSETPACVDSSTLEFTLKPLSAVIGLAFMVFTFYYWSAIAQFHEMALNIILKITVITDCIGSSLNQKRNMTSVTTQYLKK